MGPKGFHFTFEKGGVIVQCRDCGTTVKTTPVGIIKCDCGNEFDFDTAGEKLLAKLLER